MARSPHQFAEAMIPSFIVRPGTGVESHTTFFPSTTHGSPWFQRSTPIYDALLHNMSGRMVLRYGVSGAVARAFDLSPLPPCPCPITATGAGRRTVMLVTRE